MGEVYRARDTKLGRDVALKILPELFAADPDRLARFKREAQVLASLNHPHIAAIYEFEDAAGVHALVLELVEGPTLADRIAEGPIPLDEALPIARQIAEALETAHEHGIIHRDLKPANIKLRPDGTVKVLDFGLAKALDPTAVASGFSRKDLSMSPTITSPAMRTGAGMILGTAAYMSPEQARGRAVDKRTDIWAFGCVLYEMLTGRRPFDGDDVTEVLARIIEREPDLAALPASTPPSIWRLLRRCLEKDRTRRLPDIGVARIEIDDALAAPGPELPTIPAARGSSANERLLWAAAVLIAIAATAAMAWYVRPAAEGPAETRLQIVTPPPEISDRVGFSSFALSPDGRYIVYQSLGEREAHLWLRPLDGDDARALPGTERAQLPFWSPDSQSIGFFADGKLRTMGITDSSPQAIADASQAPGGTWGEDGTILFAASPTAPLSRVPARGGPAVDVTTLEAPAHVSHRFPRFLPDGRRFVFFVVARTEAQGLYAGSLDSKEIRRVLPSETAAVFVPPDVLLIGQQRALMAQRIDPGTLEPVGDARRVADRLLEEKNYLAEIPVSASWAGSIAYRRGEAEREIVWFDRGGVQVTRVGPPDRSQPLNIGLSPDGRTAAMDRYVDGSSDIWLMDMTRGFLRRITSHDSADNWPVWSPDGSRLAFASRRNGPLDIFGAPVSGNGREEALLESSENKYPTDWSADGKYLLYVVQTGRGLDVWALPMTGTDRQPFPVLETRFNEQGARLSPDGRWIAYHSDETGSDEIYVRAFRASGSALRVSPNGGTFPAWRADGRELFYLGGDNRMMAALVSTAASGSAVDVATPVALFSIRPGSAFTVTRDGQRFLVSRRTETSAEIPITVLQNWR